MAAADDIALIQKQEETLVFPAFDETVAFKAIHQLRHVRLHARETIGELTERQRIARKRQLAEGRQLRDRESDLGESRLQACFEHAGGVEHREQAGTFDWHLFQSCIL